MNLQIAGIDYKNTQLGEREKFAFTKSGTSDLLIALKHHTGECVLLSTCNRTELFSISNRRPEAILREICGDAEFYSLEGNEAVRHVFELAAGLCSQVPLEEQILTQMKDALSLSQSLKCCGPMLGKLLQNAVTAGKEIRNRLKELPDMRSASIAQLACAKAKNFFNSLEGRRVIVIGSGEMGMLCSSLLIEAGARVSMTLRRRRNDGRLPAKGVVLIPYDTRYDEAEMCDIIIGATSSPHFVIRKSEFRKKQGRVLVLDIAVPRDIDPQVADIENVMLLNMDGFECNDISSEVREMAEGIMQTRMEKFQEWLQMKDCMPIIEDICSYIEHETCADLNVDFTGDRSAVMAASREATRKLLLAVKNKAGMDVAKRCYEVLSKAVAQ